MRLKPKVCLNMIVKDESFAIQRCLESVKRLIHYWVIVDTGSTDGTQRIIRECLQQIPGELIERPWVNFEHNRNEALGLARSKGDYLLLIDADERLAFSQDFDLHLEQDCYLVTVREEICKQNTVLPIDYNRMCLIKSNLDWKWEGVVHETITCNRKVNGALLQGVVNISRNDDGGRSRQGDKFKKDAEVLEEALKKDPNNSRYVFYLGQSYRNAQENCLALTSFQKRTQMQGCEEEVFWSLFQVAILQEKLGEEFSIVEDSYSKAFRYRPTRAEPLYGLADFYRKHNHYFLGYLISKMGLSIQLPPDRLFVVSWIYEFGLLSVFADCAYQIGNTKEAEQAIATLLAKPNLPPELRKTIQQNITPKSPFPPLSQFIPQKKNAL